MHLCKCFGKADDTGTVRGSDKERLILIHLNDPFEMRKLELYKLQAR